MQRRDNKDHGDRDIFNERPTQDEQKIALLQPSKGNGPSPIAYSGTIHTSFGDIHIELYPEQSPKTVENFVGHARSGYFEGIIFHRVIPKFVSRLSRPVTEIFILRRIDDPNWRSTRRWDRWRLDLASRI